MDDTLVGGGTTSLSTGVCAQSTAGCDSSTGLVDKSIFVKGRNRGVGNLNHISRRSKIENGIDIVIKCQAQELQGSYNGDSVVVNVSSLVKLLLKLGVTLARPKKGQLATRR